MLLASPISHLKHVSLHNAQFHKMHITCSTPQSSVIGPLLFTLNINGITDCISSTPKLFVDDACFFFQHINLKNRNVKINSEIKVIEKYMIANKLTLSITKFNVIIINS